jgi:hypothetical protein
MTSPLWGSFEGPAGLRKYWEMTHAVFTPSHWTGIPMEGPTSNQITVSWKFSGKFEGDRVSGSGIY